MSSNGNKGMSNWIFIPLMLFVTGVAMGDRKIRNTLFIIFAIVLAIWGYDKLITETTISGADTSAYTLIIDSVEDVNSFSIGKIVNYTLENHHGVFLQDVTFRGDLYECPFDNATDLEHDCKHIDHQDIETSPLKPADEVATGQVIFDFAEDPKPGRFYQTTIEVKDLTFDSDRTS